MTSPETVYNEDSDIHSFGHPLRLDLEAVPGPVLPDFENLATIAVTGAGPGGRTRGRLAARRSLAPTGQAGELQLAANLEAAKLASHQKMSDLSMKSTQRSTWPHNGVTPSFVSSERQISD
jgi:hypothetical protein